MQPPDEQLINRVVPELLGHVGRADLLAAVDAIYAEVEQAVSANQGQCQACGRCCRFSQFGHILFVTTPELVYVLTKLKSPSGALDDSFVRAVAGSRQQLPGELCPLQEQDGRCTLRAIRPLGCRLFFCAPGSNAWVMPLFERMQRRMKEICNTLSLPYAYVEWTSVLRAILPSVNQNCR